MYSRNVTVFDLEAMIEIADIFETKTSKCLREEYEKE